MPLFSRIVCKVGKFLASVSLSPLEGSYRAYNPGRCNSVPIVFGGISGFFDATLKGAVNCSDFSNAIL